MNQTETKKKTKAKEWTMEHEDIILRKLQEGQSLDSIAENISRTKSSIRARLRKRAKSMLQKEVAVDEVMNITKLSKQSVEKISKTVKEEKVRDTFIPNTNEKLTELTKDFKDMMIMFEERDSKLHATMKVMAGYIKDICNGLKISASILENTKKQ